MFLMLLFICCYVRDIIINECMNCKLSQLCCKNGRAFVVQTFALRLNCASAV